MATGSQTLTTYYAKRIIGDSAANTAATALLQTGTGVATTPIWILSRTNRATDYGIKYVYDTTNGDTIEFVGSNPSVTTAWIKLDTGDASFNGNVTIGGTLNVTDATALSSTLSVTGVTTISNILQPNATNTIDLGTSSLQFKDIYGATFSGNATTATFLKCSYSNGTIAASNWGHGKTGFGDAAISAVWGQKWTVSGQTYTPSGGSATTLSDSGDMIIFVSKSNTSNNLYTNMIIDGTVYGRSVEAFGGYLTTICNGVTLKIGAQNANWIHIYNNKSDNTVVPFIMNDTLACAGAQTDGATADAHRSLGTAAYPWHRLILGGLTDATMDTTSTNPRIIFQEGTGTQPVHLVYTDSDNYRAPAGLKVIGGNDAASPAWLETEGDLHIGRNICLYRYNGIGSGRISFYRNTYKTWQMYMSTATVANSCPSGGTPSSLNDVTAWALRSYIENSSGYGWIWESAAESNTGTPTACMALSSNTGNLTVSNHVKATLSASSWLDGQRYMNGAYNIADYSNTGSYNPWMRATNTWTDGAENAKVGRWFSFGTLGPKFYWIGSTTTRTSNSTDHSLSFNISNGELISSGPIYSIIPKGTENHFVARASGYTDSKNLEVKLMVGSGKINHGVYSTGYSTDGAAFTASGTWLVYRNSAGKVILNGSAALLGNYFNYQRVIACPTGTNIAAGWRRVCKVTATANYPYFFIGLNGGWSSGAPTNAIVIANTRNTAAYLTHICGLVDRVTKVRLVNVSGSIFWLDVYVEAQTSGTFADQYVELFGNVSVSEIQNSNTVYSTSVTAAAEITLVNLYGTNITSSNISSQSVSSATSLAGGLTTNDVTANGNLKVTTAKGLYYGINFGGDTSGMSIMSINASHQGLYNQANSQWIIYYNAASASKSICIGGSTIYTAGCINLNKGTVIKDAILYYKRTTNNNFFELHQNDANCGQLKLETLGPANTEGWCTLYLGNSTASTAANNASGRIYLYNKNGGSAYLDGQYVSLGGTNRNAIRTTYFYGSQVWNAVWNDYAECRNVDTDDRGYCVTETPSGQMVKTTKRLQAGCKITSDTYGTCMGQTDEAKTPIAVSGRVLVYPYRHRANYKLGAAVCSGPGGTVDIMTREEIMRYPERIVGTVSEIPTYEVWHGGFQDRNDDVQVNGRIWIYVR